jgi:hypothetical protein
MAEPNTKQDQAKKTMPLEASAPAVAAPPKALVEAKKTPTWRCSLEPNLELTVGQKLSLKCDGLEELKSSGNYRIEGKDEDQYALHLLELVNDDPLTKEFVVTPYRVHQGALKLNFIDTKDGKVIFKSAVEQIGVRSVIKDPKKAKMFGPERPSLVLFSLYETIFIVVLVVAILTLALMKFFKRRSLSKDFGKVMNKTGYNRKTSAKMNLVDSSVSYEDPFLDLNIDLSKIEKNKDQDLKESYERALKKFFYNFFKKPIFLTDPIVLNAELKKLNVPSHELRSIAVIKNDFEKLLNNYEFDEESKKDLLRYTKKHLNRLKKYHQEVG